MKKDFAAFEALIGERLPVHGVPSLNVAVVRQGEISYLKSFGHRDPEKKLAPDGRTRYSIGSVSKAFATTALGILKDEGKVDWTTPIISYMPDFAMYDDYVTRNLTLSDMLSHRSGLASHQMLLGEKDTIMLSTAELVRRLRYLKPDKPFRDRYDYNNLMFIAASHLTERVTGMRWEDFVRQRIWDPLGMNDTTAHISGIRDSDNRALPFAGPFGQTIPTTYNDIENACGAGAVNSTLEDMAKWIALNLGKGEYKGKRIISQAVLEELQTPRVATPPSGFAEIPLSAYGYGWRIDAYRGLRAVTHSGGIEGFTTFLMLLPAQDIGIIVLTNKLPNTLPMIAAYTLTDLLLDLPAIDWAARFEDRDKTQAEGASAPFKAIEQSRRPDTKPSHSLEDYAGVYRDPGYGDIEIVCADGRLTMNYNRDSYELLHNNYDSFEAVLRYGHMRFPALIAFSANDTGAVAALRSGLGMNPEPVVFHRSK